MKKVLLILLTAVLFLPLTMRAQSQTLTVADGTGTSSYVPVYGYWADAVQHSQMIYPESMLTDMVGNVVESLTFYSSNSSVSWGSAVFSVRMAIVTDSVFSTASFNTTTATTVYSGSLSVSSNQLVITCANQFVYTGGHLLVDVEETTSGSYSSSTFTGIDAATGSSIYAYSTYSPNTLSFLPKLTFAYSTPPTCPDPYALTASVTQDAAVISWSSDETETNFDIYVADSLTDVPTATTTPTATATTNTYSMTDLEASTYYYVYVRANCGPGDVSNWKGVTFLTSQIPTELPYTQDFEDEDENANWTILAPNTNKWVIGSAVNTTEEGENALYVSSNNGVSNTYNTSSTSISWAYRDIDFGTDYAQYGISFNYRVAGETPTRDVMKVFIGNPAVPSTSSYDAPAGAMLLGTFVSQTEWTNATLLLNNTLAQGVKRIYFLWKNDSSSGDNPPAAVDDIVIAGINCARPTAVTIDSVTTETLTFHFSPATENDNAWQAMLISANDTIIEDLSDTTYTFEELDHSTYYTLTVRTDCGEEYSYWTIGVSAMTDCAPQSVPYTEDFNGSVTCWSGNADAEYYSLSISDQALSMYVYQYYTEGYLMGITPELDNEVALNTLSLAFRYKWSTYYDYYTYNLIVGTVASPDSAAATFTPIATYTYDADHDNEWISVEDLALTNAGADHHYIAFKLLTDNYITAYIDDIEVALPTTCARPSNFVSTGNTHTTVSLSWTAGAEETAWNVAYGPAGFIPTEETTGEAVYETSMTVEDLTTGTAYDFYVQADCGGETSTWRGPLTVIPGSFIFGTTGSDTLTGCGYTLYDNGGPTGNYSSNCNYILVIYPENEGEFVQVSGTYDFESSNYDGLKIYDGVGTTGTLLWNNPGSTSSGAVPAVNSSTGPLTIRYYSDSGVEYSGFVLNQTCITCVAPTPVAPIVGANMATITWPIVGTQDAWQVVYGPEGFNPDSATTAEDVVDNIYLITELTGNTHYDFYVRTNCDGEYSAWSNVLQFTTLSDSPATTPYCHDWSNAEENAQWVIMNGNQTNRWYIGQPTGETDSVLFISSDGVSESYETSSTSIVWAFRDIHFGEGAEFNLNIKWKAQGETSYDFMRVFMGPQNAVVEPGGSFSPEGITQLAQLNQQSDWQVFSANLDASYANTDQRLFFLWRNDGSSGSAPAAVIDSITITVGDCGAPYNLTVENLNPTSADLTFTPAMSADDTWQIVFGTNITIPDPTMAITVTDTVLELDTLAENTSYTFFVRTVCGDEEYSAWSSAFTFATPCANGIDSLPFTENFDNVATYDIPDCWYRNSTFVTSYREYPYVDDYDSYSEPNHMYFYSSNGTYNMLIMPKVNDQIEVNTLQVSFMYSAEYSSDFMMVGVMTNPSDASTFVALDTVYPDQDDTETWLEKIVSLAAYEGNGRYIAFKNGYTDNYGYGYIDDIVVDVIPSCPKPMSFVVNAVTSSSVTLQWNEMGEADTWEIVYGEPGFNPDTATTTVVASTNSFEVTDLQDATTYEFYVRATCSATESSLWSLPVSATTECLNFSMPFSEDFNATTGYDIPTCWDNSHNSHEYVYWQTSSEGYQSTRCAYFSGYYGYTSNLMTPKVELTDDAMVSFMYKMANTSSSGTAKVYVSTDGGVTKTQIGETLQQLDTWTYVWLDLSEYTGDTVNIIFEGRGTSSYGYAIYLDNVTIDELPSCFAPVNVVTSNATTSSLTVAWTPYGEETSWNIHYREEGTDTWIDVPSAVSDTFYTVTGLNASTSYEFQIQAICSPMDMSDWSMSGVGATACEASGLPYTQNFDSYTGTTFSTAGPIPTCWIATTNNTSYPAPHITSSGSYGWYPNSQPNCLTFVSSSAGADSYAVLPEFTDALNTIELAFTYRMESASQGTMTVGYVTDIDNIGTSFTAVETLTSTTTITMDTVSFADVPAGTTGRLAFYWYLNGTYYTCCVDDISVYVGSTPPAPGCDVPTNVVPSSVTYNSASINWTAGGTETAWNLQYKKAADADWSSSIAVTARPYNLTGLDAETAYQVRVQANCGAGETSEWSTVADFTTTAVPAEPCDDPTNLQVTNITQTSAVVTWTAGGTETAWNVQYKLTSATEWNNVPVSAPTYTIEGLTAGSNYTVQVQANCGEGNLSGWVSTTFTTQETGISNVELANSISIMPNPAESYIELTINSNVSVKEASIYNAFGQLIQKVALNDNHARIDVSAMAAGMYFVRIANDNTMATKKFIKK